MTAEEIIARKSISLNKACELTGVSRRTLYNWLASGKVQYIRTAGGSVRIFADTLWTDADRKTLNEQPTRDTDRASITP